MTDAQEARPSWDRWERLWHGVFFVALIVPSAVAVSRSDVAAASRLITAVVAAAFAVWHLALPVRHPQWRERAWPLLVYLAGAAAFTAVLVGRDTAFVFLVYGLYPQMFVLLGGWGIAGAVVVSALVFPRSDIFADGVEPEAVLSIVGSTALAIILGLFIHAITTQSAKRQEALDALATARVDVAEAARHAGVLEERQRMAREIHDTVAQSLSSIVMLLEAAEQETPATAIRAHGHLDQARHTARDGLADLRRSVLALRPELLRDASLPGALDIVVQRWSERTGSTASTRVLGEPYPLDPEAEVTLLRVAQEALANVSKHAHAHSVSVTLSFAEQETTLDIRDDGRGMSAARRSMSGERGGFGLQAMQQRLAAVGGRVAIASAPARGTTIVATVPRAAGGAG